jgi:DNA-binding MarR family transcriptional regulator
MVAHTTITEVHMSSAGSGSSSGGESSSVGRYVSILHRYWQVYIDRALAPLGIGAGQLPILIYLLKRDGVSQARIVGHLRADKSSTARTIRKLVEQGYVERRPDPQDARAYHIRVTAKAHSIRAALGEILKGWTDAVSRDLSADERAQLLGMLGRMLARAEELVHPGAEASESDDGENA